MRTLDSLLTEVPAFAGMSPEQLALIAGCAQNAVFSDGERLATEGAPANEFYVLRRGSVAVETYAPPKGALTLETLHEHDLVGWSWLVPPYLSRFDVRSIGETHAIAFDGACLRGKADADRALGYELLRRFAPVIVERLQATRIRLLDVYGSGA